MFNIFGLLIALLISEASRGSGIIVGLPSAAAAVGAVLGLSAFLYSLAAHTANRLAFLRLLNQTAAAQSPDDAAVLVNTAERETAALARRMPAIRLGADGLILATYFVLASYLGWVDWVELGWGVPRHLDILPNLLPYFALLAGSWLAQVRLENVLHGPNWRPLRFVTFQARANLMTIAPIVLVNAAYWAVLSYVPMAKEIRESFLYSEFVLLFSLMLPVFILMPVAVRGALRSSRLPDGPLRRKLEDFARRRKLRIGGMYVWETGSRHFMTAFVIGLVPGLRFVFFTDALLRRFNDDEVLAVFAHEMGHVKHRHLWWLLGFIFSFSLLMLASEQVSTLLGLGQAPLVVAVALFAYGYAVFGFLSRRFERQADDFAARETSPELMAGVLLKIAAGNPALLDKRGWRHFPIRQRVAEIALASHRPEVRPMFDAQRRRGLLLVGALSMAALLVLFQPVREDVVSGLATIALTQFDAARLQRQSPERLDSLRERTLQRAEAMGRLNTEYELAALHYEGVVEVLSGRDGSALSQMARLAREHADSAETDAERRKWLDWAETADATGPAMERARVKQTPWLEELKEELRKRGRAVK
ncbi:MAG: M48 family metalloprotease [Planctomycetes bacterium]|nr:M48 family metalloprotease [Planctomycetota bacterium]